ncbi:NAD-dependent epimerase/dehydratase family protein [Rubellimicrobium aerolatum]|uniref:NAD-dependent epimerase/dehydratase family protein n=1 Tax=Rubellimicrobium aerolatum TaxID=490979 RepID=A0ABW0SF79_9RHOB|nr:NAD-dependent epimerase/dehydratase family protein [Rubellimicrobium aerolatum]MBP1807073.1 UDP-glucose 4-epimerase [Rubellimicrobium aerolatum]
MAHWLVTGGAGFVGGHLLRALRARGDTAAVIDDLSTGRADALPPGLHLLRGSILDPDLLARGMEGAAGVFHLAAVVSVEACTRDLLGASRVNLGGTLAVLDAARRAGNRPVVLASSAAVYGDAGESPCDEDMAPLPLSPYGADKLGAEHHARAQWGLHGLPTASLRFFNVYGPGQDARSPYAGVIARFLSNLREGRPHAINGDGLQTRDFVEVGDVAAALLAAQDVLARAPRALVANVCTGRSIPLLDLARGLDRIAGTVTPIQHGPARAGDIRHSRGSPARMEAVLGVAARTPIEEGLARLLASVQASPV